MQNVQFIKSPSRLPGKRRTNLVVLGKLGVAQLLPYSPKRKPVRRYMRLLSA